MSKEEAVEASRRLFTCVANLPWPLSAPGRQPFLRNPSHLGAQLAPTAFELQTAPGRMQTSRLWYWRCRSGRSGREGAREGEPFQVIELQSQPA